MSISAKRGRDQEEVPTPSDASNADGDKNIKSAAFSRIVPIASAGTSHHSHNHEVAHHEAVHFHSSSIGAVPPPLKTPLNPYSGVALSDKYFELLKFRQTLPLLQAGQPAKIIAAVRKHPVVIVVGGTGSGKSTQIPQLLLPYFCGALHGATPMGCPNVLGGELWGTGQVLVTQPRRVAAISLATRVTEELDVHPVGTVVGYAVRFEEKRHPTKTKLLFATDGMVVKEAMSDPDLSAYSLIIIDEAHERKVQTDIFIGAVKRLLEKQQQQRAQAAEQTSWIKADDASFDPKSIKTRVIVMSATVDTDSFVSLFGTLRSHEPPGYKASSDKTAPSSDPPVVNVPGRMYPVTSHFIPESKVHQLSDDYVDTAVEQITTIHRTTNIKGDILCFLTGADDIDRAVQRCESELSSSGTSSENKDYVILPLHASLPLEDQRRVFNDFGPGRRKIIFSTNVAETSLTIDGVVYVVDCGLEKMSLFDPVRRYTALKRVDISQASVKQRMGRAGRTQPGECYHLYTEKTFSGMLSHTPPEVQRVELTDVALTLLRFNMNCVDFPWVSAPAVEYAHEAMIHLALLGAVDVADNFNITTLGEILAELPVRAEVGRMIIAGASEFGCGEEVTIIAAMLEAGAGTGGRGQGLFFTQQKRSTQQHQQNNNNPDAWESYRAPFRDDESDHITFLNVFRDYMSLGLESSQWAASKGIKPQILAQAARIQRQIFQAVHRISDRLAGGNTETESSPPSSSTSTHQSSPPLRLSSVGFAEGLMKASNLRRLTSQQNEKVRRAVLQGFISKVAWRPHQGNNESDASAIGGWITTRHPHTPAVIDPHSSIVGRNGRMLNNAQPARAVVFNAFRDTNSGATPGLRKYKNNSSLQQDQIHMSTVSRIPFEFAVEQCPLGFEATETPIPLLAEEIRIIKARLGIATNDNDDEEEEYY